MSSVVLPCLGLASDAHAMGAPKGAMRAADNVVVDLPGVARPRPNFTLGTNKSTTYVPTAMHVFGNTRIVVSRDGSSWRLENESSVITGNAVPPKYDEHETSFAESRGSLYYTTDTGVRALRVEGGTDTVESGLGYAAASISPRRGVLFAQTADPADPGWAVAWCWVVKRTDTNGIAHRSPPSTRWTLRTASATSPPTMPLYIADSFSGSHFRFGFVAGSLVVGDEIEFYRTKFSTTALGTPAADMYLTFVYTITAADVASSTFPSDANVIIKDLRTDLELGEALYTNPQREGALRAKYGPPIARDVALWSRCLWFGNTKERHRLVVTLVGAGRDDAASAPRRRYPETDTIGARTFNNAGSGITGDYVIGTPTIANVTDVTGASVGDYLTDGTTLATEEAGSQVPADTQVVSITGSGPYTVTMNKNALSSATGAGVRFYSRVTVAGVDFRAEDITRLGPNGAGFTSYKAFGTSVGATSASRAEIVAGELVKAINAALTAGLLTVRAYHVGGLGAPLGSTGGGGQIVIEQVSLSSSAFTFSCAKANAWAPRTDGTLTSTQEVRPNRVYYSLPDEPEAVPLLNYIDIGSDADIQRLIPLRSALMVFKKDGLFRITGSAPNNWNVDLIDPALRLVRPETVAVLDGKAYAWTNRGICEVDESGVRAVVSAGKIDTDLFASQGAVISDSQLHGCRVLASERHRLILVTTPAAGQTPPVLYGDTVFCYATKTGAWTKWPATYLRCGAAGSDGVLWVAANNSLNEMEWETRYLIDSPRGFDRARNGVPWTATEGSVTVSITNAQRGEWVPTVGDWLAWKLSGTDNHRRIVAAVDTGGNDYTMTLDRPAPDDVSATDRIVYEGCPVVLEWLPSAMGTAGVSLGVWRELLIQFDGLASTLVPATARFVFEVRHDGAAALPSVTGTPDRAAVQARPYRMGWPRNASRRAVAAPRLSWSEIFWSWRLAGVALVGEDGSERVRR